MYYLEFLDVVEFLVVLLHLRILKPAHMFSLLLTCKNEKTKNKTQRGKKKKKKSILALNICFVRLFMESFNVLKELGLLFF